MNIAISYRDFCRVRALSSLFRAGKWNSRNHSAPPLGHQIGKRSVAGRGGVNQGYLSELESGLKSPTLPKMASIAKGLGIHPLTLITAVYANLGPEDSQQL
ncbi:helix-turn-helix domain-containing protein [Pseudomonas syringae]|uniref:helix-turn-helix domain-containing protein n=1 Tax=Pseudomonas TaxID=286 RepID=UPI0035BBB2F3